MKPTMATIYRARTFAGLVLLGIGAGTFGDGIRIAVDGRGPATLAVSILQIVVGAFIVATGVRVEGEKP